MLLTRKALALASSPKPNARVSKETYKFKYNAIKYNVIKYNVIKYNVSKYKCYVNLYK